MSLAQWENLLEMIVFILLRHIFYYFLYFLAPTSPSDVCQETIIIIIIFLAPTSLSGIMFARRPIFKASIVWDSTMMVIV